MFTNYSQMNNYNAAKDSAGIFTQNKQTPHYLLQAAHPVHKMILGHATKNEMIALSHTQVEAHIVVSHNQLRVIQIPFRAFDVDNNVDMDHLVVAGTIGLHCSATSPCSYGVDQFTTYFSLIKKPAVATLGIPIGKEMTDELIASLSSTYSGLIPEEKPFVLAAYPRILPKLVGVEITKGSISSNDVLQSMLDYDEAAAQWLKTHIAFATKQSLHGHALAPEFHPALQGCLISPSNETKMDTLWPTDNDEVTIANQVQAKIAQIMTKNMETYYETHKLTTKPVPVARGGSEGHVSHQLTVPHNNEDTDTIIGKKHAFCFAALKLFYATTDR